MVFNVRIMRSSHRQPHARHMLVASDGQRGWFRRARDAGYAVTVNDLVAVMVCPFDFAVTVAVAAPAHTACMGQLQV
jgi:hypothetical protein